MTDTFQKSVIFTTFLLSLFCGSLICTSLVTNHWIVSKPWRQLNPLESSGSIYFGLLYGRKELNVAFGLRTYNITVSDMIEKNPDIMSWSLWCSTLISTVTALVSTGLAAFLAVINSVTTPRIKIFSVPGIFITNIISFLLCFMSSCIWFLQFHTNLYRNILSKEDLDNFWTSEGASILGFSFWLVVLACSIHFINIILLKWNSIQSNKKHRIRYKNSEEKIVGAIMLY